MARIVHVVALAVLAAAGIAPSVRAQGRAPRDTQLVRQRWQKERELEAIAQLLRRSER